MRKSGTFIHLEAVERRDAEKARLRSNRERHEAQVRGAIAAGFTAEEAPFAVVAKECRTGDLTVAAVRAHLRATMPGLYER